MASYRFYCFGLLMWLCLLLSGGVQGRILHAVQRDTNNSSLKVSSNGLGKVASQTSLLAQTGGIHQDAAKPNEVRHMAAYEWKEGRYYGVKTDISIYSLPTVQANQISTSAVWVESGSNFISAGWHVDHELYGDNKTHFFIVWSADAPGGIDKSNCINLMCKGFIPSERSNLRPGDTLDKVSVYNGYQSYLTLKISQDSITRDWWLHNSADDEFPVGYWPNALLPDLADGASYIFLGGMVNFIENETSPPMGSGHFPTEGDGKAASFRRIKFVDKENRLHDPSDDKIVNEDKESCSAVGALLNFNEEEGYVFYYGGPDGCKD